MSQDFIIKIRVALAKHGKNQNWLAEKLEISKPYMSDIMKGKRSAKPQVKKIEVILHELEKKNKEISK